MTSVKEFRVDAAPTETDLGRGRFVFTDDYSVFDWGRMPDEIPGKGASLCTMGAFNFERLEAEGVPTHYRGVVPAGTGEADAEGPVEEPEPVALAQAERPPRQLAIDLTEVPDLPHRDPDAAGSGEPGYDYDAFHAAAGDHYLIPLEIVFRNEVPVGSSLRSRADPGELGLDIGAWPDHAVTLAEPLVEFSTKFEEQDRYLADAEADRIAGRADLADLRELALEVNRVITDQAETRGFVHEDGKIECLYADGEVRVADVAGTFDENRFAFEGQEVSKEVVRQFYKGYDPEWVDAVSAAKAEARERGIADWRERCERSPEPLPEDVVGAAADLYLAGTNAYTGRAWFDAPDIEDAVAAVADL